MCQVIETALQRELEVGAKQELEIINGDWNCGCPKLTSGSAF